MKQRLATVAAAAALVALMLPGVASAANTQVVDGKVIGSLGTLMVATSNQMTLYTFTKDVKDSGISTCTGGCLTAWPALTVAAGDTPTGGAGVTGTLGTITRTDNGALQVTYNGLPLYFFHNDVKVGDTLGIYANWEAVVLAASTVSPSPRPTATAAPAETEAPTNTPPPTSTVPGGPGSTPGDSVPALLFAAIAALGFIVAIRRLAVVRS
jgi:predicted lipoprotein with Yx(FWY)xxD motif